MRASGNICPGVHPAFLQSQSPRRPAIIRDEKRTAQSKSRTFEDATEFFRPLLQGLHFGSRTKIFFQAYLADSQSHIPSAASEPRRQSSSIFHHHAPRCPQTSTKRSVPIPAVPAQLLHFPREYPTFSQCQSRVAQAAARQKIKPSWKNHPPHIIIRTASTDIRSHLGTFLSLRGAGSEGEWR